MVERDNTRYLEMDDLSFNITAKMNLSMISGFSTPQIRIFNSSFHDWNPSTLSNHSELPCSIKEINDATQINESDLNDNCDFIETVDVNVGGGLETEFDVSTTISENSDLVTYVLDSPNIDNLQNIFGSKENTNTTLHPEFIITFSDSGVNCTEFSTCSVVLVFSLLPNIF